MNNRHPTTAASVGAEFVKDTISRECSICSQVHDPATPCGEATCPCFRCGEVMSITEQWFVKSMEGLFLGPFCGACKDIVLKESKE